MSIFDFNSISETVYKGPIQNPDWISVPAGEYLATITDVSGRETPLRRIDGVMHWCDITWEVLDDEVKRTTNMEHPRVRQSFPIQFIKDAKGEIKVPVQLDQGPNMNMPLKNVWRSCGVNKDASIAKLRNQTAYISVIHEAMIDSESHPITDMDGKQQYRAVVNRVTSIEAARAAQRKPNGA